VCSTVFVFRLEKRSILWSLLLTVACCCQPSLLQAKDQRRRNSLLRLVNEVRRKLWLTFVLNNGSLYRLLVFANTR
jgi:hypothetical protein